MSESLSPEARGWLPHLAVSAEPVPFGRSFWHLTSKGILSIPYPPGFFTPKAFGFVRVAGVGKVRGPTLYSPLTGERLQRVRLWVPEGTTEQQMDEWIRLYKKKPEGELVQVFPAQFDVPSAERIKAMEEGRTQKRNPRMFEVEFTMDPLIEKIADKVVEKMNLLPYQGTWRVKKLKGTGETAILVERGIKPSILIKLKEGTLWGVKEENFPMFQMQHISTIPLSMLAANFPTLVTMRRISAPIPPDVLGEILEDRKEDML